MVDNANVRGSGKHERAMQGMRDKLVSHCLLGGSQALRNSESPEYPTRSWPPRRRGVDEHVWSVLWGASNVDLLFDCGWRFRHVVDQNRETALSITIA